MSDRSSLPSLAARLLAEDAGSETTASERERDAGVARIAVELDARAKRRGWARRGMVLLAVAAAVGLFVGWRALSGRRDVAANGPKDVPEVMIHADGGDVTLQGRSTAVRVERPTLGLAGDRIAVASGGHAQLVISTGSRLDLESGASLQIVEADRAQVFALHEGSVEAAVVKLREGERFVVRTADADVEVRGTRFRVSHGAEYAGCGALTRVTVTEGTVAVRTARGALAVRAGETWPTCTASADPTSPPSAPKGDPPSARVTRSTRVAAPAASPGASASASSVSLQAPSELADQNALFSEAMTAKAQGDTRGALERLDRFRARYPTSPLSEGVDAERMKLLAKADPAAAQAAAREYLARYPNGFARAEAERMLRVEK
jgi:ferric-dicitrate binding protein FerR (iron transport regulator)